MNRTAAFAALLVSTLTAIGCAPAEEPEPEAASSEDELAARADDHWFYGGPLAPLESPVATVSLAGHTARVTGYYPADTSLPSLPHMKTRIEGSKLRVDLVYPIATARPGKSNSRPAVYWMSQAKPYRPDGPAFTRAEGWHDVPWGGFPFLHYNNGIAFHGPITDKDNKSRPDQDVWYLERGKVSGGCNRMMGEHVVEMAHVMGTSMRRVYEPNRYYATTGSPKVRVIADYDMLDGKYVDVDYPTATGATRPASIHGAEKVEMFGSWLASETPDGRDLPPDMKWKGGVQEAWYVFAEHTLPDMVCSVPKRDLPRLKTLVERVGGELPATFCAQKACVLDALRSGGDASTCGL